MRVCAAVVCGCGGFADVVDESVGGDDGSVISEIFQPILPKKRKRHVDEDTSVSSSSTSRSQKQASVRAKNGTASTPQRTGEDEDDGNVKSGMSVLKPSEHESFNGGTRSCDQKRQMLLRRIWNKFHRLSLCWENGIR